MATVIIQLLHFCLRNHEFIGYSSWHPPITLALLIGISLDIRLIVQSPASLQICTDDLPTITRPEPKKATEEDRERFKSLFKFGDDDDDEGDWDSDENDDEHDADVARWVKIAGYKIIIK